jgi:hypothetical protein
VDASLLRRCHSPGNAWRLAWAAFVALSALGCGGAELPPSIPSTTIHDRFASRVELVDLVISDGVRAEKVRKLYIEIERLMLAAKRSEALELMKLGTETARTDAEVRESIAKFRSAEVGALERYIALQAELRTLTTPAEFARLDAIK